MSQCAERQSDHDVIGAWNHLCPDNPDLEAFAGEKPIQISSEALGKAADVDQLDLPDCVPI